MKREELMPNNWVLYEGDPIQTKRTHLLVTTLRKLANEYGTYCAKISLENQ